MGTTKRRLALWLLLGLYVLALGFLGGMAAERIRFDERRDAMLRRYDDSLRRWHTVLMAIEKEPDGRAFSTSSSSLLLGGSVDFGRN
jgi:hypothetical protein